MDTLYVTALIVTSLLGLLLVYSIVSSRKRRVKAERRRAQEASGTLPYQTIDVTIEDKVAILTFDRARKKNAFSKLMYKELERAIRSASVNEKISVIMLTGSGDYYSSGNDLSNLSELKHPLTIAKEARDLLLSFVDCFISCQKPIIVAVNGPAIGIAVTTLGLCDKVFAAEKGDFSRVDLRLFNILLGRLPIFSRSELMTDRINYHFLHRSSHHHIIVILTRATFNTPFAALGQSPEGCSSFMFPRIMGEETAKKVLGEGFVLNSQDALKCGLIHCVVPEASLIDVVKKYCHHISSLKTTDPELTKRIKKDNLFDKLNEINLQECNELEKVVVSKKCFTALAKYLESRKMKMAASVLRFANFTGSLWGQPR